MKKNYLLSLLVTGTLIVISLQVDANDNQLEDIPKKQKHILQIMEVTEEEMLSNLDEQEQTLYKQLNPQQKALVLKVANQACIARLDTIYKTLINRILNPQD